jgi:ribosomal protein L7/L12
MRLLTLTMSEPLPEQVASQIRSALAAGNKIEAIRIYREFSGASLVEAKDFIERLASGAPPAATASVQGDTNARIQAELFAGNKIAAIKLHREATHCGLAEAKAQVEQLEAQLRASSPERFTAPAAKGCAVALLALMTLSVIVTRLLF